MIANETETNKITQGQFFFMIIQTQVGVGTLSLPFHVWEAAKGDGWISVLIAGVAAQILILLLWGLNRRFPSLSLYDFLPRLTGSRMSKLLILGYSLYFTYILALILVLFHGIVRSWILTETPIWVINGLMALAAFYLVTADLRHIVRLYVFISTLLILLIVIACFAYIDPYTGFNYRYLFPLAQITGPLQWIKGAHAAIIAMLGFELILVVYPQGLCPKNRGN
jgi:hypothetical protein